MVYVTGDMHGDEARLFDREWRKLKPGDTLIALGDFGYLWNGSAREKSTVEWLGSRKFTVAFLDGPHENYDAIRKCRTTYWKGGMVHRIRGNLLHLMRGQVFTIEGMRLFTFGGGESDDKEMRLEQGFWWEDEMPSPTEMADGARRLDEIGCRVDYILTHEPPSLVKSAMLMRFGEPESVSKLNGYLEEIGRACEYRNWYFGAMHEDRRVTPRHTCVYRKLLPLAPPPHPAEEPDDEV